MEEKQTIIGTPVDTQGTIYIKVYKKVLIKEKRILKIKDVAEIIGEKNIVDIINELELDSITIIDKGSYLFSITDIILVIQKYFKQLSIQNLGPVDTVIEYNPTKENKLWTIIKVIFVACIIFSGAAIAIMTFHTDVAMPEVHRKVYQIFMGEKVDKPYLIQIPYSIGIAVGIIVFFNHFLGNKLTEDPTPLEVEMNKYSTDLETCRMDMMDKRQKGKKV